MQKIPCLAITAISFAAVLYGQITEKLDTPQAHAYVVTLQPHMPVPSPSGHATNRVLIFLDDGVMARQETGAAAQKLEFRRGDVRWRPASGAYVAENTSEHPIRILEIELKGKPAGPAPVTKLDPTVVDAKHYRVVLENDQVRVLRIHYDAHEKSPEHEHILNRVVLFLNDQRNGKTDEVHVSGTQKHTEENDGDRAADRIAVELK
jgi:hypothetical protein